jgi:FemAB-related protein (PEP-CTERM system-associated)
MTSIRIAESQDRNAWDHYVSGHARGLAYHYFAWKEAVEIAYGFQGYYLMAEKNARLVGVLPLVHHHPPFVPGSLVSIPYCDAAGPLADSVDIEKLLVLKAMECSRNARAKGVSIRSIQQFAGVPPDLTVNSEKARMILNLPGSSDELLASLKAKVRSQVKKPIRDGLTVHMGGIELLNGFYKLFAENMRDLGSPVHSKRWLYGIIKAYRNRCHLFLVRMPDNTPAAGGILLCHSRVVSVPWASSLRRFNRWNPNMLLYWSFLKFASDHGYLTFDFGRSTPGEGTFLFKKQWGAKSAPLHWADFEADRNKSNKLTPVQYHGVHSAREVRKHVEHAIMSAPLSVSKVFGSLTRKYITL